jgi:uncharacterized protein YbaP (TraB family)
MMKEVKGYLLSNGVFVSDPVLARLKEAEIQITFLCQFNREQREEFLKHLLTAPTAVIDYLQASEDWADQENTNGTSTEQNETETKDA